jgi:hypothetical protein
MIQFDPGGTISSIADRAQTVGHFHGLLNRGLIAKRNASS